MHDKIELGDSTLGRLLRRGFVLPHDSKRGLIILLRGKAGTGKSTLALQILDQIKTAGPTFYCTLEQSSTDLQNKLIAMRISRALEEAQTPHFESGTECFTYEVETFKTALDKVGMRVSQTITDRLFQYNNLPPEELLPLYHEPHGNRLENSRTLYEDLVTRAGAECGDVGMQIKDGAIDERKTNPEVDQDREGPFDGCHSRLIQATYILQSPLDVARAAKTEMDPKKMDRDKLPIVALDGLSLLSSSERETLELQGIIEQMRKHFQLGILVYEPNDDKTSNLDHHADMVIDLERKSIERPLSYLIHEMCIRKARYQDSALGSHQFKIRGSGLVFFPSIHFQVHHYNYMDLEIKRSSGEGWSPSGARNEPSECKDGSLIDLIFAPKKGESVVLLGSRNSVKTQISLDFLARGNWGDTPTKDHPTEEGLLISLIDNAPHIEHGLKCPCSDACINCTNHLIKHARAFCQRPGYITPAEFFHYVSRRINMPQNSKEIKRVVFWDITQMDYRFPLFKEDKMLLPALMDTFKTGEIKSLFMGAGNAENTKAASAMADHVLFCWRSFSKWNKCPLGTKQKPESSLMLYVDRTSVDTGKSGKALYAIPVFAKDELRRPQSKKELDRMNLNLGEFIGRKTKGFTVFNRDDARQIDRITIMQGVQ